MKLTLKAYLYTSLILIINHAHIVAQNDKDSRRPNIVWLISEDNSVHYSNLYFESGAETPHIRELAEQGVVFNHAFSVAPVCSVARSTLATGCYPSRLGMQHHRSRVQTKLPSGIRPIFEILYDAGYHTSFWKKNDFNFEADMKKWTSSKGWKSRQPGQPFFHKHQFQITHESQLQRSNKGGTEAPEFVMPRHPNTPLFRQAHRAYLKLHETMDEQLGQLVKELKEDGVLEDTFIFYFGDHGGVLPGSKGYLYETGLHVPLVVRIPKNFKHLIQLKPGTRMDGFVEFVDIGPTTLNLAGIPIPQGMDGRAFMGPEIDRAEVNARDEALGVADRFDEKYDLVRTLRKGNLKYIRNYLPFNFHGLSNIYRYKMASWREWRDLYQAGKLTELQASFFEIRPAEELFDISKDPFETVNLAKNPHYRSQLTAMRHRLGQRLKDMPDLGFIPERDLINEAPSSPLIYGEKQKKRIHGLLDLTDLQLLPFETAKDKVEKALRSEDPIQRYWALIVCSTFHQQAKPFVSLAKSLAQNDRDLLVRARAAEFLGLIGAQTPQDVMISVLGASKSTMETCQVLNMITLLQDGKTKFKFDLSPEMVNARGYFPDRNLVYLCGIESPRKKDRLRK